jgi:hypothetical protein
MNSRCFLTMGANLLGGPVDRPGVIGIVAAG